MVAGGSVRVILRYRDALYAEEIAGI